MPAVPPSTTKGQQWLPRTDPDREAEFRDMTGVRIACTRVGGRYRATCDIAELKIDSLYRWMQDNTKPDMPLAERLVAYLLGHEDVDFQWKREF